RLSPLPGVDRAPSCARGQLVPGAASPDPCFYGMEPGSVAAAAVAGLSPARLGAARELLAARARAPPGRGGPLCGLAGGRLPDGTAAARHSAQLEAGRLGPQRTLVRAAGQRFRGRCQGAATRGLTRAAARRFACP